MVNPALICIVGPTAVGKTSLSIRLAQQFNAAILITDPRQMYRGLDIGTAKPTPEERTQAPHFLIDSLPPDARIDPATFEELIEAEIARLFTKYPVIIAVGGATLYMDALWYGLDEMPAVPAEVRESLTSEWEINGLGPLLEELAEVDPATFDRIDKQNPVRILRALEVYRASGHPISTFRTGKKLKERVYPVLKIGLQDDREKLYQRIDQRVLNMLEEGLLAEIKGLLDDGLSTESQAFASIGYREVLPYLKGEYEWEEAVRLIQRNSRRYAKRQLTYWRRDPHITWFQAGDTAAVDAWIAQQMS